MAVKKRKALSKRTRPLSGGEAYLELRRRRKPALLADAIALRYKRMFPDSTYWCRHGYSLALNCPFGCHIAQTLKNKRIKPKYNPLFDLG
jgi:hypothetical protein